MIYQPKFITIKSFIRTVLKISFYFVLIDWIVLFNELGLYTDWLMQSQSYNDNPVALLIWCIMLIPIYLSIVIKVWVSIIIHKF